MAEENTTYLWGMKPKTVKSNGKKRKEAGNEEILYQAEPTRVSFREFVNEKVEERQIGEKLPDKFEGYYTYDYNILEIDTILKKKFTRHQEKKVEICQKSIEKEKINIANKQTLIERKLSRKRIADLEKQLLSYQVDKKKYIEKSKPYIDAYKKLKPLETIYSFSGSTVDNTKEILTEDAGMQEYRHKIIFEYLEIARKYIQIDLIRSLTCNNLCKNCGVDLTNVEMYEDETGCKSCPNCGLEKINVVKSASYADNARVNNARNNYDDRVNFEKALKRRQGKQPNKPPKELYEKIDGYFRDRDQPTMEYYLELPHLKDGTKENTNREMIFDALSQIGCSGYFDDIDIICSIYFGWILPDYTDIEDAILDDYDGFQEVYNNLDKGDRKSNLNVNWKLFLLLKRRNIPCRLGDFKIPCTQSIRDTYTLLSKEAYSILEWEWPLN